jgi:molybdate transport system substrate-binding protein
MVGEGAEITLVAPGGIRTALQKLLPQFEANTGWKVVPSFMSGGAAKAKIIAGEPFDVPILQPPLEAVIASSHVVPASETPLAAVSVVLAVRSDVAKPDISTADGVKNLLLGASSIACPSAARGAACGVSFEASLLQLGIGQAVAPKIKPVPSGWVAIETLARGEVEVGVTFASEMDPDPRIQLLGPLPRAISTPTGFVAFVNARARAPKAASALIEFLRTSDAAKTFVACGMMPGK